jgi:hypothetical protein
VPTCGCHHLVAPVEVEERLAPARLQVRLLATCDDGTLLTLVHSGLPLPAFDIHRDGWSHHLDRLTARATGGDPGPDATDE